MKYIVKSHTLRSDLKSGLPAESDRIAKAIRNSFNAGNQASRKIVMRERELCSNSFPHFSDFFRILFL
jgi:hypothetical protein